jgi:hypothetical protein
LRNPGRNLSGALGGVVSDLELARPHLDATVIPLDHLQRDDSPQKSGQTQAMRLWLDIAYAQSGAK